MNGFPPADKSFEGAIKHVGERLGAQENRTIPNRLWQQGIQVEDLNDARAFGQYWANLDALNLPVPQPMSVRVMPYGGDDVYSGRFIQEARTVGMPLSNPLGRGLYVRTFDGSAFTSWMQTVPLAGFVTFPGSGGAIRGSQAVEFPPHYFVNPPAVIVGNATNAGGAILAGEGLSATVNGFTAVAVANTGAAFTGTYVFKWIAQEAW